MSQHGRGCGQVIDIELGRKSRSPCVANYSILYLCSASQSRTIVHEATAHPHIPTEFLATLTQLQQALVEGQGEPLILIDITPGDAKWIHAVMWLKESAVGRWIGVLPDFDGPLWLRALDLGAFDVILRSSLREELGSMLASEPRVAGSPVTSRAHTRNVSEMPRGLWQRLFRST